MSELANQALLGAVYGQKRANLRSAKYAIRAASVAAKGLRKIPGDAIYTPAERKGLDNAIIQGSIALKQAKAMEPKIKSEVKAMPVASRITENLVRNKARYTVGGAASATAASKYKKNRKETAVSKSAFGVEHVSKAMSNKEKATVGGAAVGATGAAAGGIAYKNRSSIKDKIKPTKLKYETVPPYMEPLDMEPLKVEPLNDGKNMVPPKDLDVERFKAMKDRPNATSGKWVKPGLTKLTRMSLMRA